MDLTNMKAFVTGAGGFIGSHLCERLLSECSEVTALVRYNARGDWGNLELLDKNSKDSLRVVMGNIEDNFFVSKQIKGMDVVFHLAALIAIPYSYVAPLAYVRTNIEGTLNILQAARDLGISKLVHTSTSEVYGSAIYTPIDENHPLQGQSPYSASKIAADKLAESYFLSFDLPVVTVRPFNTYGPRQSARAVIPTIITQALTQESIRLGSLEPVRDLNFVMDTVEGFVSAAGSDNATGQTINLGSGKGISVGEIARTIIEIIGCHKAIVHDPPRVRPEKSEVRLLICDNSKASHLLHWEPRYSLRDGLDSTIDHVSKNLYRYKPNLYAL